VPPLVKAAAEALCTIMKIDTSQIPAEGIVLEEDILAYELDLDTDTVRISGAVHARAEFSRITNAITVRLELDVPLEMQCSRCLNTFAFQMDRTLKLNYHAEKANQTLDLNPDIRQEIFLEYPIKPLCGPDCKGLCPSCGKNLNEGPCSCP